MFLRQFIAQAYRIQSASMHNTLLVGDYVLVDRLTYGAVVENPWTGDAVLRAPAFSAPKAGDIVVFESCTGNGRQFVKRCVGLAGDTVHVRNNRAYVNGVAFDSLHVVDILIDEPCEGCRVPRNYGPHIVAPGHIFVLGDNRNNSEDSRTVGDIALSAVRGRVVCVYWSRAEDDTGKPIRWKRIGAMAR